MSMKSTFFAGFQKNGDLCPLKMQILFPCLDTVFKGSWRFIDTYILKEYYLDDGKRIVRFY